MRDAYIVGTTCTPFGRSELSITELTDDAARGAVGDIDATTGGFIDAIWFGSCFMQAWGQPNIRGHAALVGLFDGGFLAPRTPITNVEAACATGSMALRGAALEIQSGSAEVALAIGVEKMHLDASITGGSVFDLLAGCSDRLGGERLTDRYESEAAELGVPWEIPAGSSMFMQTYALQARQHMTRYGITAGDIAAASSKTHNYAAQNPLAQYRFSMTPQDVLDDRLVADPFTRSMCAPIGDGAAAALVCSGGWLAGQAQRVRDRAVKIAGIGMSSGGYYRTGLDPTLSYDAANRAYAQAGVTPSDIDLAEVHDATSYGEILQAEMLGLCPEGKGGELASSGATGPGGSIPINTSGGLIAKGHPVGATGLSMIHELTTQLRHEAGLRQVERARTAIAENGGGVIGLEEAACVVTILEATS